MFKKIKGLLSQNKHKILSWEHKKQNKKNYPIIYRFQGSRANIKEFEYFLVKDYESALVYKEGELFDIFNSGLYTLEKNIDQIEIIWIETKVHNLKWGIPKSKGIQTKQGKLGGHGEIKFRISNVRKFFESVIGSKQSFDLYDLKEWINSLLLTSLRQTFRNFTIEGLHSDKIKKFTHHLRALMIEDLVSYGLTLESFNILGIKL
jgi:membrane protease subunit (stomatin/prohibitin family)